MIISNETLAASLALPIKLCEMKLEKISGKIVRIQIFITLVPSRQESNASQVIENAIRLLGLSALLSSLFTSFTAGLDLFLFVFGPALY